jgi:hypothetical protein
MGNLKFFRELEKPCQCVKHLRKQGSTSSGITAYGFEVSLFYNVIFHTNPLDRKVNLYSFVWALQLPLAELRISLWCLAMEMIVDNPVLTVSGTSWFCSFSASSQIAANALDIFSVLSINLSPYLWRDKL